jgi:putative resolvase
MNGKFLSAATIKKTLDIDSQSLRHWAGTGKIESIRTPGGQRRYKIDGFISSFGIYNAATSSENTRICYARVSTAKQKEDLGRQIEFLKSKFPNHEIVTDIGSGINWKRPGLRSILERSSRGGVLEVVVASRDRLCRFAFEAFEYFLDLHGVRVIVLDSEGSSEEQELADDLLSIVQIFCCRKNGRRSYSKSSKDKVATVEASEMETRQICDNVQVCV